MTNTYKANDAGAKGKTFEKAIKERVGLVAKVSSQGKVDMRKGRKNIEIKTGAGELGLAGNKLLANCSMVIYVPVIDMEASVDRQEGFVLTRESFLAVLDNCGLIREKTSTDGARKVTIQTFWNASKNAPTSRKKYAAFIDSLYESCEATLEEWLAQTAPESARV